MVKVYRYGSTDDWICVVNVEHHISILNS